MKWDLSSSEWCKRSWLSRPAVAWATSDVSCRPLQESSCVDWLSFAPQDISFLPMAGGTRQHTTTRDTQLCVVVFKPPHVTCVWLWMTQTFVFVVCWELLAICPTLPWRSFVSLPAPSVCLARCLVLWLLLYIWNNKLQEMDTENMKRVIINYRTFRDPVYVGSTGEMSCRKISLRVLWQRTADISKT